AFHKLLKSDEEAASGDVQLLCKLFSGERTTYHFSTEHTREIEANTPFAILGSTQMQNAAKLIARMDQGHGLMDRFLISVPLALRPTPEQQTNATDYIDTEPIDNFEEIFGLIQQIHQDNPEEYNFETEAIRLLQQMNSSFTADVNAAILDGVMPPKSKKSDLVPRIALALHVFTHATSSLLNGQPLEQCPTMISKQTLERAVKFVEHLELQKDALCQARVKTCPSSSVFIRGDMHANHGRWTHWTSIIWVCNPSDRGFCNIEKISAVRRGREEIN
ncbi:Hypothetical predicted protein, partial [Paramuricea clavata]